MTPQTQSKLDQSQVALRLSLCAAAVAGVAGAGSAQAALVTTFANTVITLPNTVAGVYINLLTGATGTSAGTVAGWDINPYLANAGTQLGFYWGTTPAASHGGVAATITGPLLNLPASTTISSASTFSASIISGTTGSAFLANTGEKVLGFRFFNEGTGAVNYGYMRISTTAGTGYPASIRGWVYENSGGSITTPIPEPATGLMLGMGALALGAVHMRRLRRERQQAATH